MTGVLNIASAIGALFTGSMADNMGRRPALLLAGSLRAGGSVLMGFSPNFPMLCIARFIAGLGVGAALIVGPLYTAEIAPARFRGRLISITVVGMNIGIVIGEPDPPPFPPIFLDLVLVIRLGPSLPFGLSLSIWAQPSANAVINVGADGSQPRATEGV